MINIELNVRQSTQVHRLNIMGLVDTIKKICICNDTMARYRRLAIEIVLNELDPYIYSGTSAVHQLYRNLSDPIAHMDVVNDLMNDCGLSVTHEQMARADVIIRLSITEWFQENGCTDILERK